MDQIEKFNWIRHNSGLATLVLDIPKPPSEVKEEILKSTILAVPHRDHEGYGWRSLTLHGHSSVMTDNAIEYSEFNLGKMSWTDVAPYFPHTVEWIKQSIPFDNYGRIRIMIVDPGGYVSPHKDFLNGQCLAGINVAITHPKGVMFDLENYGEVEWQEGESRLIDLGSMHQVVNKSTDPRIHIIVHSDPIEDWGNKVMQIVNESYEKRYGSK